MDNEPSNFDPDKAEKLRAYQEAEALRVQILAELDRIRIKTGRGTDNLFNAIFRPAGIDRATLLGCVVYHGLIASSPPSYDLPTDLPGEQNLMAFCKTKLEELKLM